MTMTMTNHHPDDEQLIGYVYHTLTDAEREAMNRHLAECQNCRARLAEHERMQRRIHQELQAGIKAATPPDGLDFGTIEPRLRHRPLFIVRLQPVFTGATAAMALGGLAVAFLALWDSLNPLPPVSAAPVPASPLSALACFFLVVAAMGQVDWKFAVPRRFLLSAVLAVVLWLGTAVIGLQNMVIIRDLTAWGVLRLGGTYDTAVAVSLLALVGAALVWIVMVVGGGEYHYRHFGQRRSWRLFAITIAIQLLILLLPYAV